MKTLTIIKSILFVTSLLALNSCDKVLDMNQPGALVPKTVDEDLLLPRFEVNGIPLHGETFGDINNPILIFLHGGPGSDYRAMISEKGFENTSRYPNERSNQHYGLSRLQDEYFCIFYDQRGAGLSPRFDRGQITFEDYISDLDEIINFFIIKKQNETGISDNQVRIFGWSYGGTLGTGYTNRYPEKVAKIACYEPGPFSQQEYEYFIEHTTSYFAQTGSEWLEEYLLAHEHFSPEDHIHADYQYLLGAFRSNPQFNEDPGNPLWRFGALYGDDLEKINRDNTSNLSSYEGKFLFIGGEFTLANYPEYANLQMSHYPNSEFSEIPNVGHTGPWEKPDQLMTILRNFLKEE